MNFYRDNENVRNCGISLAETAVVAYNKVKGLLANTTKYSHINTDHELYLAVDTTSVGIGAVLLQNINNVWKPITFFLKEADELRDLILCVLQSDTSDNCWKTGISTSSQTKNAFVHSGFPFTNTLLVRVDTWNLSSCPQQTYDILKGLTIYQGQQCPEAYHYSS